MNVSIGFKHPYVTCLLRRGGELQILQRCVIIYLPQIVMTYIGGYRRPVC